MEWLYVLLQVQMLPATMMCKPFCIHSVKLAKYTKDMIISASHEPYLEPSLLVTTVVVLGHIEEQVSQKSSISTRLAQHFPSVFNFLRRHPSSSNDTNGNDFKVMKKTDSNKMENKVPVEGISGGFDDSGEIQNAPNVRSSDIYSLRDYDSGSDQNEAPLLPGTSDSSGYYDEITEVISTSHREPLSGWSLGPGHQLAQE